MKMERSFWHTILLEKFELRAGEWVGKDQRTGGEDKKPYVKISFHYVH